MFKYSYLFVYCFILLVHGQERPVDIVNGEEYEGSYLATQSEVVLPSS